MDMSSVLWALGIAAVYAVWPIIGKYSGASGAWISSLVVIGTLLSTGGLSYVGLTEGRFPTIKAIILLIIIGIVNGAAVYFYSMKTSDPNISTGAFIVLVTIFMVVMAPFLDLAFNGSAISLRQWGGIVVAAVAVYLLQG